MGYLLVFILLTLLAVSIFVPREQDKQQNEVKEKLEQAWAEAEEIRRQKLEKFRKLYDLPSDTKIYHRGAFYGTSPMQPTEHEQQIADSLIEAGFFNSFFVFLDGYFKTNSGRTGQIDVLAVGKRGIFIFESKDYNGWIYGNGKSTKWTQVLHGKKFHFYNPIKQNYGHLKLIQSIVGEKPRCHSIVVFGNNATLKEIDYIPKNTYVVANNRLIDAVGDIIKNSPECLTSAEVLEICQKLNKKRLFCSGEVADRHVKHIVEDVTGKSRLYL